VSTHAGRRSLESIVRDLLHPLLATAERIERDLAGALTPGGTTPRDPPAHGGLSSPHPP
jgi:hypothetical protein